MVPSRMVPNSTTEWYQTESRLGLYGCPMLRCRDHALARHTREVVGINFRSKKRVIRRPGIADEDAFAHCRHIPPCGEYLNARLLRE